MPRYRTTGGLDDAILADGDRGFVGMNQRDTINLLPAGMVRESKNGRIDGGWKPRRNVVSRSGALTTGGGALRLPFYLIDSAKTITAAAYVADNKVRITITGHGFADGSQGQARVSGLTTTAANGDFLLSYVDANTLEYTVPGLTAVTTSGGLLSSVPINDAASSDVRASCLFSDPATSNQESVIVALDTVAKKINLATYQAEDLKYPVGRTLSGDTDMIQAFDKIILFREGQQSFEWYPNGRPILTAARSGTVLTVGVRSHGLLVGDSVNISGLTGTAPIPAGDYVVTNITKDTFQVAVTNDGATSFGVTNAVMKSGFTLSEAGSYTQPQTFLIQAKDVDVVSGLVTATVAGNVTVLAGDTIVVRETDTPAFAGMLGKSFQVVSAGLTMIQWYAPVGDYNTSSTDAFEFGGNFSVGGGFSHQPGPAWGTYFQRRLWVPYYYDTAGTFDAPTFTDRKIRDEIAVSDILDSHTFDQIENQFRVSGGTADFLVAMHGFYEDSLIVFNRNSLHLIKGTQGSLLDTRVIELTSEIGCLARRTVVSRGNRVMFLSDDGVYAAEFLNDYNLRGADLPISRDIQPYIDRINARFASDSVGILHDNRYFLAVPLDSAVGANDARGNNAVLIFNFLNNQWESIDSYGDPRFLIKNFVVGTASSRNNLFAVSANGGLHQMEVSESSIDFLNLDSSSADLVTVPIDSVLTSRGYDMESLERKRFTDLQFVMQNVAGQTGEYLIEFSVEDPDSAVQIGTTTKFLGSVLFPSSPNEAETAGIRARLGGLRGYTGTVILTRTIGSPTIHSVKVAGSITNRQISSQK